MLEPPLVFAIAAAIASLAAWLLTRAMTPFLDAGSLWLRSRLHVLIAAVAALGAVAVADTLPELVAFTAAGVGCALLIVIDLAVHRLPDVLVAGTLSVLLLPLGVAAAVGGQWEAWGRSLLAALVLVLCYFVLALIAPAGLGLGDVKFAAVIGALLGWFGWSQVAMGTLLGFILNGVIALVMLISRRGHRTSDVPFGPSMMLGAVLALALSF